MSVINVAGRQHSLNVADRQHFSNVGERHHCVEPSRLKQSVVYRLRAAVENGVGSKMGSGSKMGRTQNINILVYLSYRLINYINPFVSSSGI